MSKPMQYALAGTVSAVYLGIVVYCYFRGWRQDAFMLLATVPALILGIMADRRGNRCRLFGRRPTSPAEEVR